MELVAGTTLLSSATADNRYVVDRVIVYPLYDTNDPKVNFDVAVMHITRPAVGVTPAGIGLHWYPDTPYPGDSSWVAGWGLFAPGKGASDQLLVGQISVSSRSLCEMVGGTIAIICGTFPESFEASACFGDSGGPLMNFPTVQVIGIVSTGPSYCGQGVMTSYTDVGVYSTWISHVTRLGDPGLSLPMIIKVTARDVGPVIRMYAEWCQLKGAGRQTRVDFTIYQGSRMRMRPSKYFTLRGRAPKGCSTATYRAPDTFSNGTWQVIAKVIDLKAKMSADTDYPARVRVTG